MIHLIPVRAMRIDRSELLNTLKDIEKDSPGISVKNTPSSGLAMDAETIALVVDVAKVTIPALITLLGSVWVAHIEKKKESKTLPQIQYHTIMVIETTINNIKIDLKSQPISDATAKALPQNIDDIVRIRFE